MESRFLDVCSKYTPASLIHPGMMRELDGGMVAHWCGDHGLGWI